MADLLGIFALLIGLELVLGVDNILVISIFVSRLEEQHRQKARIIGLGLALLARIVMLFVLIKLTGLTDAVAFGLSVRDLILIVGGLFLLYKAVKEIHETVELTHEQSAHETKKKLNTFSSVITQIVLLDIVFSIDSVITAIGLTDELWVIIAAVLLSFTVLLFFARTIGEFIMANPALKILALSFLITIGVTIFLEGIHTEIPKGYIYLPMGFALFVELLQMRYYKNKEKHKNVSVSTESDDNRSANS